MAFFKPDLRSGDYLDTNDFNYQQDFNTPLILDEQIKEAEKNYFDLIILAKRLQFKFGLRKEAFSVYNFVSQYKNIRLIKQDILNFVQKESPKIDLSFSASDIIDYQVNAQDDENQEQQIKSNSSTPEELRRLQREIMMKNNNIDSDKYLEKEKTDRAEKESKRLLQAKQAEKVKHENEKIINNSNLSPEAKENLKSQLKEVQNPDILRHINDARNTINTSGTAMRNLGITQEDKIKSRQKLKELEKSKTDVNGNSSL